MIMESHINLTEASVFYEDDKLIRPCFNASMNPQFSAIKGVVGCIVLEYKSSS